MFFQKIIRRLRFFSWLISRFLSRYSQRTFSVIIILLILSAIGYWIINFINPFKPVYREGIIGSFTVEKLPQRVTSFVTSGLTKANQSANFEPDLATWTVSDDGKTYTFKLKDNLYWQDGQKIKTTDLVIAIEGVKINYPDEQTVDFNLNEPFSPFPSLLSKPVFRKNSQIGTGKYKIKKVQKDLQTVSSVNLQSLDRNLPNITFTFYPTEESGILALKLGEVDAISGVFNKQVGQIWPSWTDKKRPEYNKIVTLFFNTKDPNIPKELRHAFHYLINHNDMTLTRAITSIAPNSWAYNSELKDYEQNPQKALELVKDLNLNDQKITLTTLTPFENLAKKIAQSWQELGITIEVVTVGKLEADNYQILLAGQEYPIDPDQYTLWHSTQKTNLTKLSSPKIDKLLEDGRKLVSLDDRKQKYLDFQRALRDETPAIFLYYPDYHLITSKRANELLDKISKIYPWASEVSGVF